MAAAAAGGGALPYQTPEARKEEFRKYLEKAGVVDALTKGAWRTSDGNTFKAAASHTGGLAPPL